MIRSVGWLLAACLVVAAGWWVSRRLHPMEAAPAQAATTEPPSLPGASSRSDDGPGGSYRTSVPASMPLPQGPFDQRRATLEWLASQGRADAAYELGRIVTACVDYEPVPDYAFVTMLAQATSWLASFRGGNPGLPEPSELVELVIHTREEMEVLCRGTEALRNGRGTGDGHRWLLQAASAGHAAAMARYAHASLAEYASSNALLDHAREVAMRRDRGRVFLERALAAGEQAALLEYSRAYGDGGVFEPDAVRAQAYWRAYRSTPAGRQVPAAADRMRLRGLSDTEARESERLARRIEARFQQARRRR